MKERVLGFKSVRKVINEKLKEGRIQHETRSGEINEKNLLSISKITKEEVIELINTTKGNQYKTSPHHTVPNINVHIFTPVKNKTKWYIKCYLLEPDIWFISVHK